MRVYRGKIGEKKGQFKIQQMSFMLLAVALFFILVALFYLAIQYSNLRKQATQLEQEKAFMIAGFLADSSEFSCADESYCLDADKIIVLMNKSVYKEFWPVSFIKVRKIYPVNTEKKCNKANYPDCNLFEVYENKRIISKSSIDSFIALCRHEKVDDYSNKICELGKIIIGYEIK